MQDRAICIYYMCVYNQYINVIYTHTHTYTHTGFDQLIFVKDL